MGNQLLREFVQITRLKNEYEELLKKAKAKVAQLEPLVAEYLGESGIDKITIEGHTLFSCQTRYLRRKDGVTTDDVSETLRDMAEWKYLVRETYNGNSLRSAVLEVLDAGGEIPSQLASLIEVDTTAAIRCRRSGE